MNRALHQAIAPLSQSARPAGRSAERGAFGLPFGKGALLYRAV